MKWVTGWSWLVSITGPKSLPCVRLLIFDAWADSPFCCLQVTGVILLAVGVWGKVSLETYFSLAAEESTNAPYVLIGTGAIIVIFGLFGCFATCRGSPWMLKLVGERAVGNIPSLRDDLAWLFLSFVFLSMPCFWPWSSWLSSWLEFQASSSGMRWVKLTVGALESKWNCNMTLRECLSFIFMGESFSKQVKTSSTSQTVKSCNHMSVCSKKMNTTIVIPVISQSGFS